MGKKNNIFFNFLKKNKNLEEQVQESVSREIQDVNISNIQEDIDYNNEEMIKFIRNYDKKKESKSSNEKAFSFDISEHDVQDRILSDNLHSTADDMIEEKDEEKKSEGYLEEDTQDSTEYLKNTFEEVEDMFDGEDVSNSYEDNETENNVENTLLDIENKKVDEYLEEDVQDSIQDLKNAFEQIENIFESEDISNSDEDMEDKYTEDSYKIDESIVESTSDETNEHFETNSIFEIQNDIQELNLDFGNNFLDNIESENADLKNEMNVNIKEDMNEIEEIKENNFEQKSDVEQKSNETTLTEEERIRRIREKKKRRKERKKEKIKQYIEESKKTANVEDEKKEEKEEKATFEFNGNNDRRRNNRRKQDIPTKLFITDEEKIEQLEKEVDENKYKIEGIEKELDDKTKLLDEKINSEIHLSNIIISKDKLIDDLRLEKNSIDKKAEALQNTVDKSQKEIEILKEENEKIQKQLQEKLSEIKELTEQKNKKLFSTKEVAEYKFETRKYTKNYDVNKALRHKDANVKLVIEELKDIAIYSRNNKDYMIAYVALKNIVKDKDRLEKIIKEIAIAKTKQRLELDRFINAISLEKNRLN